MHFQWAGKKVRILGISVTIFMLIFVGCNWKLYLSPDLDLPCGPILFALSLLSAPAAGLLITLKAWVDEKYKMFANMALFFLLPVATIQMVECFNGNYIWWFSVKTFMANYIVYMFFYLFFFILTGRIHMVGLIMNISLLVWSILNYFVELFRGTPFIPMDFLSFKTAMNVSDGYTYELSWKLICGCILFFLIYLTNKRSVNVAPKSNTAKVIIITVYSVIVVGLGASFFCTDFSTNTGYKPDFWDQARGYHRTGSFFNFILNTKYLIVQQPSNYNAATVDNLVEEMLEANGVDHEGNVSTNMLTGENDYVATATELPNIICIMNESWSDLESLGDLETNTDTMPYIHSLTENTIKGSVSMPVFGAGTSNSEFEFLSGDSISFLPAGCNVYQSYIKSAVPSLVSTLLDLGYSADAFHPYYGSGWNRENVYPLLGFNSYTSIEDFIDNDILETYKQNNDVTEYEGLLKERYPDKDILLRRFVSDEYDYKMVEEMYENRDADQPFFLFNVTMQNHGGYAVSYSNFYQRVYATNMSTEYPKANRYLSLIRETDDAFKQLTSYFSKVEEPTIICMFGDHLPSIEDEFYEELFGVNNLSELTVEQQQARYTTPFVIWANYDITDAEVDTISANYLSTLLLQAAGLPMTEYNRYLASLYQTLPVINTVGEIDSDGNYYLSGETTPYDDLLNDYNCISYNALLDTKAKDTSLFYLSEAQIQSVTGN